MSAAQERLDALMAEVVTPTGLLVKFSDIEAAAGMVAANIVAGTLIKATDSMPLMQSVITAMSTTGLLLSDPSRQQVIAQLAAAGSWTDQLKEALHALVFRTECQWQIEGYTQEPTLESVQAELDRIAVDMRVAEIKNEILNAAESASDRTKKAMAEAYRKAADLMEA